MKIPPLCRIAPTCIVAALRVSFGARVEGRISALEDGKNYVDAPFAVCPKVGGWEFRSTGS